MRERRLRDRADGANSGEDPSGTQRARHRLGQERKARAQQEAERAARERAAAEENIRRAEDVDPDVPDLDPRDEDGAPGARRLNELGTVGSARHRLFSVVLRRGPRNLTPVRGPRSFRRALPRSRPSLSRARACDRATAVLPRPGGRAAESRASWPGATRLSLSPLRGPPYLRGHTGRLPPRQPNA